VIACRALVFDMDGLMVDSEPLWFDVERRFARQRGGDWTEELAHACVGRGIANTLRTMRDDLGLPIDLEQDAAAVVAAFVARVGELALKSGCEELLEDARGRGVPCALASSSARRLVNATLDRFAMQRRFDAVVSGDDVARVKPAPDIFLEAARLLAVDAADCVVLEDSMAGVEGARAAGMRVIAVPEHDPSRFAAAADAVVRDLHEAKRLLAWP
jgi:HAD superfamily hydrolase (TIGR01509 family)